MNREELKPYLDREIDKWSAKSYQALREELREGNVADARTDTEYHVEVDLLENRDDYVNVSVAVCSEKARWSCYHPLSSNFLVYRNGSVERPSVSGEGSKKKG